MKNTFIKTSDVETAEQLRVFLNELPKDGEMFVFVNDPTIMNFEEKYKKCVFTDKLNF